MKTIDELIENGKENEFLDFKSIMYNKSNKEELLKDLIAFANADTKETRYIIIGIKDDPKKGRELIGIDENEILDSAEYQELIFSNIEPELKVEVFSHEYKNKIFFIFAIKNPDNKPYMFRKKFNKCNEGDCFVRKGSTKRTAKRFDFDRMYSERNIFRVKFTSNLIDVKEYANVDILFENLSKYSVIIKWGVLELFDDNGYLLTRHRLYGFDKQIIGADFKLSIPRFESKEVNCAFGFESSDCIRLEMKSDGFMYEKISAKLTVIDVNENEYTCFLDKMSIIAEGDVLWKVKGRL